MEERKKERRYYLFGTIIYEARGVESLFSYDIVVRARARAIDLSFYTRG